jgi:two-component system, chemotaxis family, protein-glutamate methylesterase/glutaminase
MAARDLVVIGGSAGAIEPLHRIVERVPADFPGTLLITLHVSPQSPGHLAEILTTTTGIPVSYAADGQRIQRGRALVAPPDRHLLIEDGILHLSHGPRENRARPAIDPMFRTAAVAYRERVTAVVLSGLLDDGADGLIAVKRAGGRAIVQDPAEAAFPDMPQAALRFAEVDEVLPAASIGHRLVELVREEVEPSSMDPSEVIPDRDDFGRSGPGMEGTPSGFACPDCHGALWELREGRLVRFRCRTGHAYSADSAAAALDADVERALWAALRSLEEKAALARKLMASAAGRDIPLVVGMHEKRLRDAEEHARALRRMLGAEKARLAALSGRPSARGAVGAAPPLEAETAEH